MGTPAERKLDQHRKSSRVDPQNGQNPGVAPDPIPAEPKQKAELSNIQLQMSLLNISRKA